MEIDYTTNDLEIIEELDEIFELLEKARDKLECVKLDTWVESDIVEREEINDMLWKHYLDLDEIYTNLVETYDLIVG